MATGKFGLQEYGFTPEGVGGGEASRNLYDPAFDFEKFDINYNPWGEGSDAYATKEVFEQRLKANEGEALSEFTRLKRDAFGYSYQSPTNAYLKAGADPKRSRWESQQRGGSGGGVWGTKDDIATGRGGAWDPNATKDKYGREVLIKGTNLSAQARGHDDRLAQQRSFLTYKVGPQKLSKVDEYMLWRYDIASSQYHEAGVEIGSGESELYTGLSHLGSNVDKTTAQQAAEGQKGPVTAGGVGRHERQAGKQSFTRAVQL